MLRRTFLHLPSVGPRRELAIWRAGILHWDEFLRKGANALPPGLYAAGRPVVEASLAALARPNGLAELASLVPPAEHWRFWPTYRRVLYLDIETGGDPEDWGGITVVGVYDGQEVTQYVAGHNLWDLRHALMGAEILVTFAGGNFDLPVLRGVFSDLRLPPVHIDLRWVLRRLGLKGGLKAIERRLGLERPPLVAGLGGMDAVNLWHSYTRGDMTALETLLDYNAWDILNLKPLLELACTRLRDQMLDRLIA
ncbi:MAG: ribonuclease H-like domain-containing protein [Deltaproteobacteria bacterium]|nr:ribonuclease H-like domain-containing protein [Deltaproteobacteria bacterium]